MNKQFYIYDKRGGEKLLSVWWFFVLAIVGVGIVAGVLLFYSAEIDVREYETEILHSNVAFCLVEQGFVIDKVLNKDFDILKECKLNKEIMDSSNFFYVQIDFLKEDEGSFRETIRAGDFSFEKDCGIQKISEKGQQIQARYYPKCLVLKKDVLYYEDNQIKKGVLEILTASNQIGEKLSLVRV